MIALLAVVLIAVVIYMLVATNNNKQLSKEYDRKQEKKKSETDKHIDKLLSAKFNEWGVDVNKTIYVGLLLNDYTSTYYRYMWWDNKVDALAYVNDFKGSGRYIYIDKQNIKPEDFHIKYHYRNTIIGIEKDEYNTLKILYSDCKPEEYPPVDYPKINKLLLDNGVNLVIKDTTTYYR